MNIIKYLIAIISLVLLAVPLKAQGGPKLQFTLTNEVGDISKVWLGVDSMATNGWDSAVVFTYKDTSLMEDVDLPPFPPYGMICYIIKDSTRPYDSYSYVDFKSIPKNTKQFVHKYRFYIRWANVTAEPTINIDWGKLPDGIDSAKIRAWEWMDTNRFVNMKTDSIMLLDNQAYKNVDITIWYNDYVSIAEDKNETKLLLYPNPATQFINIKDLPPSTPVKIYSGMGELMYDGNESSIFINELSNGTYFIKIGNKSYPFVKQ
jgi:hypothetical protein